MKFSGTLIVTDPCYFVQSTEKNDDWELCEYGMRLDKLGFKNFMSSGTHYGDWSCTFFTEEGIATEYNFAADAGMVCVTTLEEINKYNPDFEKEFVNSDLVTKIDGFNGEVEFINTEAEDTFSSDLSVLLTGSHNLISYQTGF